MTQSEAQSYIGQRVKVHDDTCYLNGEIVDVRGFTPRRAELFHTSGGPLDWTRPGLRLVPLPQSAT